MTVSAWESLGEARMSTITVDSRMRVTKDQFSADIGGEFVVLSLATEMYYSMAGVASRIWELVQGGASFGEIETTLLSEYEVEPGRCRRDLQRFLNSLAARGIIEVAGSDHEATECGDGRGGQGPPGRGELD